nr:hypothetical protein BaRGS_011624 [Batillaria attramentaria]
MRCCPLSEGYILHSGNCIKLYTSGLNYTAAGDSVYVVSFGVSVDVVSCGFLSIVPKTIWLGADANNADREFVWSDGSPLPIGSPLWDNNQPDNHGGNQYCASHWGSNLINDADCHFVLPFICQIDG